MRTQGLYIIGAALLSGLATADAQIVTREVTEQPVETIISRFPYETVVTRRPLPIDPNGEVPAAVVEPPAVDETVEEVVVPPVVVPRRRAVAVETIDTTTTRAAVRSVPVRRARVAAQRVRQPALARQTRAAAPVVRTQTRRVVTTAAIVRPRAVPLALTPAERDVIYRDIVQREVIAAPPAAPPVVYQPPLAFNEEGDVVTVPAAPLSYPPPVSYRVTRDVVVGSRLPRRVPLSLMPTQIVNEVPVTQRYGYATVNGHILLVEPASGIVVADVTE